MPQQTIESTTQVYLDIHDITDDVLILKDGSSSIVVTVNAMNFGLLAEPEQDAIMYAYAGLLNSLNYPVQIVIRSQTKDVTSYLNLLKEEQANTTSDLKRGWIERYRAFVADLIKERNVLDKKFYIVVSATSLEMGLLPPSSVIPGTAKIDLSTVERSVILDKAKEILEPRRDHLLGQFGRIGLFGRQLTTQELIQLFYLSYNPEAAEGQQITDTQSYTTPLVQASVQGGTMDSSNQSTPKPVTTPTPAANTSTPTPSAMPTTTPATPMTTPETTPTPAATATPTATPTPVSTTTTPTAAPVSMPAMGTPTPTPVSTPTPAASPTPMPKAAVDPVVKPETTIPSITKPATSGMPTAAPATTPTSAATPTPMPKAAVDPVTDHAQNEIDSTLQQLGSIGGATAAPTATPTSTATPTVSPTPMTSPTATPATEDTKKDGDAMPPLPEI